MTGVSFAAGGGTTNGEEETTCVIGYVINHREIVVDGTKFDPQLSVMYEPSTAPADSAAPVAAAEAMTATAPMTATEVVTTEVAALQVSSAMSVTVNNKGYFTIPDLTVGDWNFMMQLPQDWAGIVPEADRGTVAETGPTYLEKRDSKHCHMVVFKIRREFDVTVLKWEEKQDGTVQPGKDWKITATPQGDPFAVKKTGTTDASGATVVTLTPGKWLIAETIKKNWTPVTPASVYLTLDQYAAPGATDPVIFKNREPICYSSITVEKDGLGTDANGGSVWLGPLAGWQVTLSRPDGKIHPITQTTDGSGKTTFSKLTPGVYNIKETLQPGWKALSDNPQQRVINECDDEIYDVLFENQEIVGELQIKGRKLFQAWEKPYAGQTVGLSGWTITATLKGSDPKVYVTTTTDGIGNYIFDQATLQGYGMAIPGATITVCEEKRTHWIPVTATCVDVHFPFPVPVDYKGAVVNFTNVQDPPLPGASTTAATSAGASCATTYQVQPGDTLSGIAASHGMTMQAIVQANGIANPNYVQAGKVLCIR
jgi:hypothetical protein